MAIGDVYQTVLSSTLGAQSMKNVFHHIVGAEVGGPSNAGELAAEIEATLVPSIATVVTDGTLQTGLEVVNIGTITDFVDVLFSPPVAGDRVGEPVNSVVCWSFRYNRSGPGQRSGWKRFSGISESDIIFDAPIGSVALLLDAVALVLHTSLVGANASYIPVVVKRPIFLGTTPLFFYSPPSIDYAGVGSQVSRKRPFLGS